MYYFIYSSELMHELCYAVSRHPTGGFVYGGVLVSNCDMYIDTYKPANLPSAYGGNNHGSMIKIGSEWYIFYHRHTNGTWYSRQGCAELLHFKKDGSIQQSELTSCGLNRGPLSGSGIYPAYLACQLFTEVPSVYVGGDAFPRIMQDGRDGDEESGYVANIKDTATLGFKYFDIRHIKRIGIATRGYASGDFEIRLLPQGEKIATIHVENTNVWEWAYTDVDIPDGIHSLYFTYRGEGNAAFAAFSMETGEGHDE